MHFVYIIYSPSLTRYYVGETVNVTVRVNQHNQSHYKDSSTRIAQDWIIKQTIVTATRKDAITIEKYIKSMKSILFRKTDR